MGFYLTCFKIKEEKLSKPSELNCFLWQRIIPVRVHEIGKSKSEGKMIDKEKNQRLTIIKGTSSKFQPMSILSTYDPFSFTEWKFYRVSKCGYKLFNSLFTDVYTSDSSAKIALFTETLQNLTALNCSLWRSVGSWHTLRFSLVFCSLWVLF